MERLRMLEYFKITLILPVSASEMFTAWLDGSQHAHFSGKAASIDANPGGKFTLYDGQIQGINLSLEPYQKIRQSWSWNKFPADTPSAELELAIQDIPIGCQLIMSQRRIPEGLGFKARHFWQKLYLTPMKMYLVEMTKRKRQAQRRNQTAAMGVIDSASPGENDKQKQLW